MSATGHDTAVLKFGGEVVADRSRLAAVLAEVAELVEAGWRFVICHGGGPQVSALGRRLGLEAVKVAGQRVTDAPTLGVVRQVLAGEVGTEVVAAAWAAGLPAVGLSAGVIAARRRPPVEVAGERVDYGLVGDVSVVRSEPLRAIWAAGHTPVLSPLGVDVGPSGGLLNVNADTVAAAVAVELGARHLFAMTGVPGVLRDRHDPRSRIPELDEAAARAAIAAGTIAGGMIPKVEEALGALAAGVGAVHILAAEAGALAAEAEAGGSRGTVLRPGPGPAAGDRQRAFP